MPTCREDRFIVDIIAELTRPDGRDAAERRIAEQGLALDWQYLVRRMSAEGVLFLFFYHVKQFHLLGLLPPDLVATLSARYHANLRRNLIAAAVLKPIFAALNGRRIPFILLKGLALAELVYPGLGARSVSDADILVRRGDLRRAETCLHALGYTPRDSTVARALDNPAGYLASLDFRKEDGSLPNLHVHWHPVNTSVPAYMFAGGFDLDQLWDRALAARVAQANVRVLCPEHLVIYLCEHALRINHSFDRLILMYDLLYVLKTHGDALRWDVIAGDAARFQVANLVYLGLTVVQHYTSHAIPEAALRALRPGRLRLGEKLFLNLQTSNRRFRGSAILVYLAMNEGFGEKCRFLYRTFFPPAQILLQRRYEAQGKSRASFYLRRVGEVLSHLFRMRRRIR